MTMKAEGEQVPELAATSSSDSERAARPKRSTKKPSNGASKSAGQSTSTKPKHFSSSRSRQSSSSSKRSKSSDKDKEKDKEKRKDSNSSSDADDNPANRPSNSHLNASLTIDGKRRPRPQGPPQWGNINPIGTTDNNAATSLEDGEDSLRWSSFNNSASTAPTSPCTSVGQQESTQSLLVLPSTPTTACAITTSDPSLLMMAPPDAILSQLVASIQQQGGEGGQQQQQQLVDLLQQAMTKVLQNANGKGTLTSASASDNASSTIIPPSPSLPSTNNSDTTKRIRLERNVEKMQKQVGEMQSQQQMFLQVQQQLLEEKEHQKAQIQHQQHLLNQQQELLKQQQAQLTKLREEVEALKQQGNTTVAPATPKPNSTSCSADEPAPDGAVASQPSGNATVASEETTETKEILDRLAVFEEWEAAQQQPLTESFNFVEEELNKQQDTREGEHKGEGDGNDHQDSIETEYEDDSDYQEDNESKGNKSRSNNQKPKQKSTSSSPRREGLVDVWICPTCNFEHEVAVLQFCGVCGAANPDIKTTTPGNTAAKGNTATKEPNAAPSPAARSASPKRPQEPSRQQKEKRGNILKQESLREMAPKSPSRRKARYEYTRSKSTTDVLKGPSTPRRSRPRVPPRAKTAIGIFEQQTISSPGVHGQRQKPRDSVTVKCLDGGDGAVFDIDVLNQQLSTFESAVDGPAGSAPTRSAPKTPKVNKRSAFRRTKSVLDEPDDHETSADPGMPTPPLTARPAVRQVIPRRAKSNSTEQLRMHQLQQNGGVLVPPSPTTNKKPGGLFGAAVSALHKSPKKAISALKIAGGAVPKSLMLGGGGIGGGSSNGAKDRDPPKGKNHAFLLDSDSEEDTPTKQRSESIDSGPSGESTTSLEPPPTPRRRTSLEARARASLTSKQKTGWKKWFDTGNKTHTSTASAADEEVEPVQELDIDDSVHVDDDDEDLFEADNESGEEQERQTNAAAVASGRARRHRRNKSSDRPQTPRSANRRRQLQQMELSNKDNDPSGSRTHGSNGRQTSQERSKDDSRSPRPNRDTVKQPRIRRSKSMETPTSKTDDRSDQGPTHRLHTSDSSGQLLMIPADSAAGGGARHSTGGSGKPSRDWGRRRRNSLEHRRKTGPPRDDALSKSVEKLPDNPTFLVRKDPQEQWDKQDHVEEMQRKAEQLKQRVQGLRRGSMEHNPQSQAKKKNSSAAGDGSESTDGCSIYLDKSVGDMSEITTHVY